MQEALSTGEGIPTLDGRLICPVIACGCENVHVNWRRLIRLHDALSLPMCCDFGHKWICVLSEANGQTSVTICEVEAGRMGRGFGS